MKKITTFSIVVFAALLMSPVLAHGDPDGHTTDMDDHTQQAEARGAVLWQELQQQEQEQVITCDDLDNKQFADLGEYFMGQMMGGAHEAMNDRMIALMGEEGETQMHVTMGQRVSGCDTDAAFPAQGMNMMMQMMHGAGGGFGMMNSTSAFPGNNFAIMWVAIGGLIVALVWALNRRR